MPTPDFQYEIYDALDVVRKLRQDLLQLEAEHLRLETADTPLGPQQPLPPGMPNPSTIDDQRERLEARIDRGRKALRKAKARLNDTQKETLSKEENGQQPPPPGPLA